MISPEAARALDELNPAEQGLAAKAIEHFASLPDDVRPRQLTRIGAMSKKRRGDDRNLYTIATGRSLRVVFTPLTNRRYEVVDVIHRSDKRYYASGEKY